MTSSLDQFEDATPAAHHQSLPAIVAPRQPGTFIDDIQEEEHLIMGQEAYEEGEEYDDDEWNEEDEMDQRINDMLDAGMDEINDQDWDVLSGGTLTTFYAPIPNPYIF